VRLAAPAALAFLLVLQLATTPARAALFDDDEARKRIDTLRGRVDARGRQGLLLKLLQAMGIGFSS